MNRCIIFICICCSFLLMSDGVFAQYNRIFEYSRFQFREPVEDCRSLEEWVYKNARIPDSDYVGKSWQLGEIALFVKVDEITGKVSVSKIVMGINGIIVREVLKCILQAPAVKLKTGLNYSDQYTLICPVRPEGFKMADKSIIATPARFEDASAGDFSELTKRIVEYAEAKQQRYANAYNKYIDSEANESQRILDLIVHQETVDSVYGFMIKDHNYMTLRSMNMGRLSGKRASLIVHVDEKGNINLDRYNNFAFLSSSTSVAWATFSALRDLKPKFTPAKDKDGNLVASDIELRVTYSSSAEPSSVGVTIIKPEKVTIDLPPSKEEILKAMKDYDLESERKK